MAIVGFNSKSVINFGTPGLVGLALSYAAPVVPLLNGFLTTFTETEKEMISVERVVEVKVEPELTFSVLSSFALIIQCC
jgi:ATP-binding cassette subfamily C (CFTR/MRP) protein 10